MVVFESEHHCGTLAVLEVMNHLLCLPKVGIAVMNQSPCLSYSCLICENCILSWCASLCDWIDMQEDVSRFAFIIEITYSNIFDCFSAMYKILKPKIVINFKILLICLLYMCLCSYFVHMFMCLWLGIGQKKLLSALQYHSPLLLDRRSLFEHEDSNFSQWFWKPDSANDPLIAASFRAVITDLLGLPDLLLKYWDLKTNHPD